MRDKKKALPLFVHILFIIFFVTVCLAMFHIMAKKDARNFVSVTKNSVYEKPKTIKLNETERDKLSPMKKFHYEYTFKIPVTGTVKNLSFILPVPYDENEKQYIHDNTFSRKPDRIYNQGANTFAEFNFHEVNNGAVSVRIEGDASVRTYDLKTAKLLNKNITPDRNAAQYLKPEKYIQSLDPVIQNAAAKINGRTKEELVTNICLFVNKTLEYKPTPGIAGAKNALLHKKGKCSEFAALTVALCRARGIPARIVTGCIARETRNKHTWVEVYFDEYGWVSFDPTKRPTIHTTYIDGYPKTETILDFSTSNEQYIASVRDDFSPWYIKLNITDTSAGNASVEEKYFVTRY